MHIDVFTVGRYGDGNTQHGGSSSVAANKVVLTHLAEVREEPNAVSHMPHLACFLFENRFYLSEACVCARAKSFDCFPAWAVGN